MHTASRHSGRVREYLASLKRDAQVHCAAMEWVDVDERHTGRVVLIGDAAHAGSPPMGQGGCMAMEDACVLEEVLGSAATVESALTDDVSRRKPRTKWASGTNAKGQRQTFMFYAICVSRKKSASGLTSEFIATCSECTCSLRCLTYSYAACSRSKSG